MNTRPPLSDDIKQLIRLVRAGKLFDVQKWIADGKPTVPPKPYSSSPLRVAVETGFHSMLEILLRIETDQGEKNYLLRRAVWNNKLELIKLFVEHGADPLFVGFEDVCRAERAITAALNQLQSFAATRVRKNGQCADRTTGNIVAAVFRHDTSRALDPHLHSHAIVFNATFDSVECQWKALQNHEMMVAQKFIENVYYHELARDLVRFGYQ
ncbi:MAG: relaxase domain-containing protein, partial [Limisphaerales bacterium]